MASSKSLLFAAILIAAVAAQAARAQLLGLGLVHINGTVHCSASTPTATTPVFPNALMALQCGSSVISTTTTNSNGVFNFSLNMLSSPISTLLNDCKLMVNTPLSTCDVTLPSTGSLQSPLSLASGLLGGILSGILQLIPSGFSFIN